MLATIRRFLALLRSRSLEIEPLDRGFALGSRLFIAVLPLSLVAQQLTVQDTSLGSLMTTAFRLEGEGREAAEALFAPSNEIGAGLGVVAVVVLLLALRGFARGIQRLYLDLWRIHLTGRVAVAYQLTWALWLAGYVVLDIALAGLRQEGGLTAWLAGFGGLALFAVMWAVTPRLLLARTVPLRRLVPTIALTAVSVTVFDLVSRTYFPALATSNAERYGLIGFAFSLFSWFFVNQTIVVLAGLVGAVLDEVRAGPPTAMPETAVAQPPVPEQPPTRPR